MARHVNDRPLDELRQIVEDTRRLVPDSRTVPALERIIAMKESPLRMSSRGPSVMNYAVRLLAEAWTKGAQYDLFLPLTLPFVPFVGLEIDMAQYAPDKSDYSPLRLLLDGAGFGEWELPGDYRVGLVRWLPHHVRFECHPESYVKGTLDDWRTTCDDLALLEENVRYLKLLGWQVEYQYNRERLPTGGTLP